MYSLLGAKKRRNGEQIKLQVNPENATLTKHGIPKALKAKEMRYVIVRGPVCISHLDKNSTTRLKIMTKSMRREI